jgi:hypothetical protein
MNADEEKAIKEISLLDHISHCPQEEQMEKARTGDCPGEIQSGLPREDA